MISHVKDSGQGEGFVVSVPTEFYQGVDFLAQQLEVGNRIWGGGVGCHRTADGSFLLTYVNDEGEEGTESHATARAAVWAYLARAEVSIVVVSIT